MENETNKKQDDEIAKGDNSGQHAQQAALDASAEIQKIQQWDRLGKLISDLHEYVQPRSNVHKEIKSKVIYISTAFKRLKTLEEEMRDIRQYSEVLQTRVGRSPATPQTVMTTDTELDADGESVSGDKRNIRTVKRKLKKSPEMANKELKKRKEAVATPLSKDSMEPAKKVTTDWKEVTSRKRSKKEKKQPAKHSGERTPRKRSQKEVVRTNALIVRPKEKEKYAEILSRVKKGVPDDQVRTCVDKIRRTATGDLLIILSNANTDRGQCLQKTMVDLLGDDAKVISKGPQEDIEIRDLDEVTTREEILTALQKAAGAENAITLDVIKSLRKAYGGTQTAVVTLATSMVKKVLGEHGKIKIGWVNCRIRTVERPTRCFRCWHYGHLAVRCKSDVDRSGLCTRCGEAGHKATSCKKEARCCLCVEKGDTKNCAHLAGSSRCPIFKGALKAKSKRQ